MKFRWFHRLHRNLRVNSSSNYEKDETKNDNQMSNSTMLQIWKSWIHLQSFLVVVRIFRFSFSSSSLLKREKCEAEILEIEKIHWRPLNHYDLLLSMSLRVVRCRSLVARTEFLLERTANDELTKRSRNFLATRMSSLAYVRGSEFFVLYTRNRRFRWWKKSFSLIPEFSNPLAGNRELFILSLENSWKIDGKINFVTEISHFVDPIVKNW